SGSYDGNGHTISNLYINRPYQSSVGFFSLLLTGATVTDIGLLNCDITAGSQSAAFVYDSYADITNVYVTGTMQVNSGSGLVAINRGLIVDSHSEINISTPSGVDFSAGGLVFFNSGTIRSSYASGNVLVNGSGSGAGLAVTNNGTIEDCYTTGNVDARWGAWFGFSGGLVSENNGFIERSFTEGDTYGATFTGGLCAYNNSSGYIRECYANGNVTDVVASNYNCSGGLVGWNNGTVTDSYARGTVQLLYATSGSYYPAGFVGHNENGVIDRCFSTGYVNFNDGLKGFAARVVEGLNYEMNGNFWDIETSQQGGTAGGATGALSSQMKTPGTFVTAGWDFAGTWGMDPLINDGYPCLLWQHPEAAIASAPLFFSEYIEGTSNNKALEIYNTSETDTFALDYFRIIIAQNGGGWSTHHNFPTGALLGPGDVWVMIADELDSSLFPYTNADEIIAWSADSPVHFNGDDARGLEYSPDGGTTWYLIDVFGDPNNDPGDYWLVDEGSTQDHTLLRKAYVTQGKTVWEGGSGSSSEWLACPVNTFDYLGEHPSVIVPDDHAVTFTVDMSTYPGFNPDGAAPFITGSFFSWAAPGDLAEQQSMAWTGEDLLYSKSLRLAPGTHHYKYFMGTGWDGGEWPGDPNRQIDVSAEMTVMDTWGQVTPPDDETPANWAIRLGASRAEHGDPENYLGVAADALDAFDARDRVEAPPAPETPISLYFPHPEWEHALGDNFCTDYRHSGQSVYVWNFQIYSADTGTVRLDAEYFSVPAMLPFLLEDLHSGAQQLLSDSGSYAYFSAASETRAFRITAGDTTEPALVLGESCSGPRILKAGSKHLLDWNITGSFDLSAVEILFSQDGGDHFVSQAIAGAVREYLWTVPDIMLTRDGILKIIAAGSGGDTLIAVSEHRFAIAGSKLEVDVPGGWTLFGIPMIASNNVIAENLSDDLTDYYVVYDYIHGYYRFAEHLVPGSGLWLGSLSAGTLDIDGEVLTDDHELALESGWNLIGNPLVTDVDIDSLIFMKDALVKTHAEARTAGWINSIYGCDDPDSGYYVPETMGYCRVYWLSVLAENVWVQFPVHRDPLPAPSPMQKESAADGLIDFIAESGTLRNDLLRIGFQAEASAGFDAAFDALAPPAPPTDEYLELYVPRPDLNSILGNKFVRDIRAVPAEGTYEEWVLQLQAGTEPVTVSWTLGLLPEGMQAAFAPEGDAEFRDMQIVTDITISDAQQLIVRMGANVVGIAEDILPSAFTLEANYPNPFNPMTSIRYAIPEAARVRLSVYDLSGRRVRTLVNAIENPGFRQVVWDGRNDAGDALSSGVYLYRLEAGNIVQTRKMLFLK
ncbi:MAG: T9SS type A sorting domain-containing protein, partial [Candidatus Marinimicrobia bacterium]|nr:T9SS type A sorting domain-containing protein [Candidatus Neomarinimicrobiota bacterium]